MKIKRRNMLKGILGGMACLAHKDGTLKEPQEVLKVGEKEGKEKVSETISCYQVTNYCTYGVTNAPSTNTN